MLQYIRECLYALLHLTLRVYTDLNHYNYIMEVERAIRGKYKAYTVSEKKAILEETKVSSTREVAGKYGMNEATIYDHGVLKIYIYSATNPTKSHFKQQLDLRLDSC